MTLCSFFVFFFFNDPATPEIYPLSLPAALPICLLHQPRRVAAAQRIARMAHVAFDVAEQALDVEGHVGHARDALGDRKSTRLNSSHLGISYAVFCLKKKNHNTASHPQRHECTQQ